jgi:hypothetical protein
VNACSETQQQQGFQENFFETLASKGFRRILRVLTYEILKT